MEGNMPRRRSFYLLGRGPRIHATGFKGPLQTKDVKRHNKNSSDLAMGRAHPRTDRHDPVATTGGREVF